MTDWLDILKRQCAARSVSAVARDLGYARTSISLVVNDNYPAGTDRIAARVIEVFGEGIDCPANAARITPNICETTRRQPMPTNSADRLRAWTICQTCPFNIERMTP